MADTGKNTSSIQIFSMLQSFQFSPASEEVFDDSHVLVRLNLNLWYCCCKVVNKFYGRSRKKSMVDPKKIHGRSIKNSMVDPQKISWSIQKKINGRSSKNVMVDPKNTQWSIKKNQCSIQKNSMVDQKKNYGRSRKNKGRSRKKSWPIVTAKRWCHSIVDESYI